MMKIPKKMISKSGFSGVVGMCDCGYEQKFKPDDFNLKTSNGSSVEFKKWFQCPQCRGEYNGIFEEFKPYRQKLHPIGVAATIVLIFGLLFGGYKTFNLITDYISSNSGEPTYYDTGDMEDMTNKELEDFLEWKEKENKKEWENEKVFD